MKLQNNDDDQHDYQDYDEEDDPHHDQNEDDSEYDEDEVHCDGGEKLRP